MATKQDEPETLTVPLVLSPRDRAICVTAAPMMMLMAHGALDDFDGEAAAVLAFMSKFCDRLSVAYDITESQQASEARRVRLATVKTTHWKNCTPALEATGEPMKKEKHVRGDNGLCKLLHEGRACTYEFKRKPRAGSVAARAAEAAAASGDLPLADGSPPDLASGSASSEKAG